MTMCSWRFLIICLVLTLVNSPAKGGEGADGEDASVTESPIAEEEDRRRLPFFREWFEQQGIELPRPYGIGLMGVFMERDIEVREVSVQFLDRPPEPISDRVDFEVGNHTRSAAARFDAWVLPFVNVYALAGEARTDTSLLSRFVIDRPIGPPVDVEIVEDSSVNGPMFGLGLTAVVGGDSWFAMVDANYTLADMDLFDEEIKAWLYSGRLGWHGLTAWGQARVWGGMFYMDSERTLTITEDLPLIGTTQVFVTQRPADPLTFQLGASLTIAQRWDLLVEIGSNFDDARMLVASAGYRF